jgi:hypothetical protein
MGTKSDRSKRIGEYQRLRRDQERPSIDRAFEELRAIGDLDPLGLAAVRREDRESRFPGAPR